MISLGIVDWSIVAGYCVLAIGIGAWMSRRATRNVDEYFVAGRSLPWWVAGTSMVATSFAADTPLAISQIVRTQGLQGNWFWWSSVMAFMLSACLFSRFWHRGRFLTDAQIYELRYEGRSATVLRAFNAVYRSVFMNCIIMGWVILAMTKIIGVLLPLQSESGKVIAVAICIAIALVYATVAGMWGVVVTDLVQLAMALTGSIGLAVISVRKLGGLGHMREQVLSTIAEQSAAPPDAGVSPLQGAEHIFDFVPSADAGGLALATFVVYVTIKWWAGAEQDGFAAQRIFACRSERDARLAMLWYSFLHFIVRVWPWILVGLASIVFFPVLSDAEEAYPRMIGFLPVGLRGVMVASLLAAFMSTIDTHLNWGSSYLVTDLYRRFLARDRDERHYVRVAQLASVLLVLLAGATALAMDSIVSAWYFLSEIGSGLVVVVLLRWLWWRVNAWAEITGMSVSLVLANAFRWIGAVSDQPFCADDAWFPIRFAVIIGVSTAAWIVVALVTPPVSRDRLREFYRRIRPPGWWDPVREEGEVSPETGLAPRLFAAWACGTASVFCLLVGIGKVLLAEPGLGWPLVAVGGVFGWGLFRYLERPDDVPDGGTESCS
jgi:Na+/proline symporter